jgi:signal transduction histidine kinase
VQIAEQANEAHLIVRDSGMGFEIEAAERGSGLGLTSMRERLKLINGELFIESTPGKGTNVRARVPLRAGTKAVRACA